MRNMKIITCLLTITSLVFTACGGGSNDIEKAKSVATTEHLKRYTEAISHDSCQGRKPFSEGADRAVNYIAHQMKEVGLKPINGDSYLQQVNIISSRTQCPKPMVLSTPEGKISLDWLEGYTAFSARIEPEIDIDNAELVFAGYGIVAPEYGKNDFEGIENPRDKVAVVIVNDPGLGSDNTDYLTVIS